MHQNASKNYNQKTAEIALKVREENLNLPTAHKNERPNTPSPFISKRIDSSKINDVSMTYVNGFGNEVGICFFSETKKYIIDGELYDDFIELSKKIACNDDYQKHISCSFIKKSLAKWLEIKVTNKKSDHPPFIQHLNESIKNVVKEYEVLIPIDHISAEENFFIGNVEVKVIDELTINDWFTSFKETKDKIVSDNIIEKFQKNHQGFISVAYRVNAEQIRAKELAYEKFIDAFMILRIFSPSNHLAQLKSFIDFNSWNNNRIEHCLIIDSQKNKIISNEEKVQSNGKVDTIPKSTVEAITNSSLSGYISLIQIEQKNEFQLKLYDSLQIYSKHTLQDNLFDKLLYILISLESILLKNETEAITQNISERIAFTIGKGSSERKKIVQFIKKIYGLRSKFIHHGKFSNENYDDINRFLSIAWRFYSTLIQHINNFKKISDFFNYIEDLKFR